MLVVIIFRLVLSKNSQSYTTTIADIWKNRRNLKLILPQPRPIAPSALTQARQKLDEDVFKTINRKLIEIYETEKYDFSWFGHRLFAVDGTKINLPRALSRFDYDMPTCGYHPQGLVSALYQLKSKLPYDFDLVNHANERTCAIAHLARLKAGDVVVYDRGYFSYSMLYKHQQCGVLAIFRLQESSFTEIRDFIQGNETDKLVTIELRSKSNQRGIKELLGIDRFEPLPLRLIKYHHNGSTFYLGTTLFDQERYPAEIFSDLYHARWGIEELYKISKVLINIEDFHSKSTRGVRQELFAHFVLISLSRLLANQAESDLNGFSLLNTDKGSQANDCSSRPFDAPIKVNFKNCLAVVSRHLEELISGSALYLTRIINDMLTSIRAAKQKFRNGRSYARVSMKPVGKWRVGDKTKMALAP